MPTQNGGAARSGDGVRRLSYWISETLKSARVSAGISEDDLARVRGVSGNTIRRLEKEESFDRGTIDRYLAGYAYVLGIDDPRKLWEQALTWWYVEGAAPEFSPPDGPAQAFARAIQVQARRQRQARAELSETQTAIPKKREAQ
jgi:transcriptional regulator with XRE-family HTH domain